MDNKNSVLLLIFDGNIAHVVIFPFACIMYIVYK